MRFEELGGVEKVSRESMPVRAARLLIADDHALVREGLRTMLSGEDGIEVIAEAHDGQQALEACRELAPDLVLMDVSGERLLGAVRRTLEGESPLNQELAMRLLVRLSSESDRGSAESAEGGSGAASTETPGETPSTGWSTGWPPEVQSGEIGSEAGGSGRSSAAAGEMESLTPR